MVDFKDYDDVERWLLDKPREIAGVIAARAALRSIPALVLSGKEINKVRGLNVRPIFRAMATSWVCAAYPARAVELYNPILYAARAADAEAIAADTAAARGADSAESDALYLDAAYLDDAFLEPDTAARAAGYAAAYAVATAATAAAYAATYSARVAARAAATAAKHAADAYAAIRAASDADASKNLLGEIADDVRMIENHELSPESIAHYPYGRRAYQHG